MTLSDLTIGEITGIVLTVIGIFISWLFRKKISGLFRSRDVKTEINQNRNKIQGDMAGGNIINSKSSDQIDSKRTNSKINQTDNKVDGDMAGGNIVKED